MATVKMSKSNATEPSLGELAPETIAAAAEVEKNYQATRRRLHALYGDGSMPPGKI
jgi:hypothetical protein